MEAPPAARVALGVLCLGLCVGLATIFLPFISLFESRTMPGDHEHTNVKLRLLSFNIEHGGDIDSVAHVIKTSQADIVALQEVEGHLALLATKLGWYYDLSTHILSKHPIVSTPQSTAENAFSYVIVDGEDGVVCVANLHLASYPYGPDLAREGASLDDLMRTEERTRLPTVKRLIEQLSHFDKVPTFVLGDFNSPSHLDWTTEMVGVRPQITMPVAWPSTLALANASFNDSYRAVHPSPLSAPGITWWAKEANPKDPSWPTEADPLDRIDFVFARGVLSTHSCDVIGEEGAAGVAMEITPWTSDHRGVVATFSVLPADLAPWVSVPHSYAVLGVQIPIRFALVQHSSAIIIVQSDADGDEMARSGDLLDHGTFEVSTEGWPMGDYTVLLESPSGMLMRRTVFSLLAKDTPVQVTASCSACDLNAATIAVTWTAAPGNRWDWIAIYSTSEEAPQVWRYTNGQVDGVWTLSSAEAARLPSDTYVARVLLDNTLTVLAQSPEFTVTQGAAASASPSSSSTGYTAERRKRRLR